MKKTKYYIYLITIFVLLISITGCKKFLSEQSQSELRPASVEDLTAIMAGDGYPYNNTMLPVLNLLTDDVQCNVGQNQTNFQAVAIKGRSAFTWQKTIFEDMLLSTGAGISGNTNVWQTLYKKISGCNTVLDYLSRVSGIETTKNHLKGEALAMRAYYYFMLVNFFGKPYNAEGADPETSPGVPLKLTMSVTDSLFHRNSVAAVYRQIEADLKEGAALMAANGQASGVYKFSQWAAYAMLSRVYLYQEKWDDAITYADKVIAARPGLTNLNNYKARPTGGYYLYNNGTADNANRIYDLSLSKEILWMYRPNGTGTGTGLDEVFKATVVPGYSATLNPPYAASDALLNLYDRAPTKDTAIYLGDLRSRVYLISSAYYNAALLAIDFKFTGGSDGVGGAGIRTAEVYLNRAEANIQKFLATGNASFRQAALNDINTLRVNRYDSRKIYQPIAIADGNELLIFYKNERRREFPFDSEHRWFDLRRYGMPALTHTYAETPGSIQTFTLAVGDNRYTLPIPKATLDRNGNLIQNP